MGLWGGFKAGLESLYLVRLRCVWATTSRGETEPGMISLNIFNGKGGLSQAEIEMATPDESEMNDLRVHVPRCAKRFRLLAEGLNGVHGDVSQVKMILLVIGGYLVVVSQPAQNVIGKLLGFFGGN